MVVALLTYHLFCSIPVCLRRDVKTYISHVCFLFVMYVYVSTTCYVVREHDSHIYRVQACSEDSASTLGVGCGVLRWYVRVTTGAVRECAGRVSIKRVLLLCRVPSPVQTWRRL